MSNDGVDVAVEEVFETGSIAPRRLCGRRDCDQKGRGAGGRGPMERHFSQRPPSLMNASPLFGFSGITSWFCFES